MTGELIDRADNDMDLDVYEMRLFYNGLVLSMMRMLVMCASKMLHW